MPELSISTITGASDLERWDAYVDGHPDSTFFHRAGWYKVLPAAMGHRPYYLWAHDEEGSVKGIMPLFQVKSFLFGNNLVSIPMGVYGGAIGDTPEIKSELELAAANLARELEVDSLEVRNVLPSQPDWPRKSMHSTFIKEIADNDADNLALVKYKQRAVVRKALKTGFTTEYKEEYELDEFFHAYSTSVRNLGTPVFSKSYFRALKIAFGDDCEIVSIKKDGELHCALVSFYFKDHVLPFYGGGLPVSRKSKAMDFMYFDQMCRAGRRGVRYYDFGRSKNDSGPYNYKRHWGFEPTPLNYEYYLVKSEQLPDLNPQSAKYAMMIETWKKLPLWLSQAMGPVVSKYLG